MTEIPDYRTETGALFSDDEEYRYWLWRTWDPDKPVCAFIMLNPSTADEEELDPTCRRARGYAEDWGYGTLLVGNIFALRSTDPDNLYDHPNPDGPANDDHLQAISDEADIVVAGWGTHGAHQQRGVEVASVLDVDLHALDTTKAGHPNHPLYQPKDLEPTEWTPEAVA